MKHLYFCHSCKTWNVEIEDPQKPEWWYVYCRKCYVPHHLGDCIACSIEESLKIAGNIAAKEASDRSHKGMN